MNSYELADLHHMLDHSEIDLLKSCVQLLPASPVIINIGANVGTSSIAMLEERPDAFIFSVDLKRERERDSVIECGLDPSRIVRVLGDSAEIGKHWPYPFDLVFVDGSHTDEGVRADIEYWVMRLRPGGVVLYHDYNHPNYTRKPNVHLDDIVNEAMSDGWDRIGEARYLVAFRRVR